MDLYGLLSITVTSSKWCNAFKGDCPTHCIMPYVAFKLVKLQLFWLEIFHLAICLPVIYLFSWLKFQVK